MTATPDRIDNARKQFFWKDWYTYEHILKDDFRKAIEDNLLKHLTSGTPSKIDHRPTQKEMDNRDNDLANIFNTSPKEETKWDLYMRIIEYLVKKWFLQKGISE